jgi:hypothetical protein
VVEHLWVFRHVGFFSFLSAVVVRTKGAMNMKRDSELTEICRQYAAAYAAHYTERNLPTALQLYRDVIASHPGDPEAGYSRTQIQNIIHAVVPQEELLDAHIEPAVAHFRHEE